MLVILVVILDITYQMKSIQNLIQRQKKSIFIRYLNVKKRQKIFLLKKKKMICSQDVVFFDDKNELLGELLSYQEIN